jgi:hypothetical protein
MREQTPVPPTQMPPAVLPLHNLVPMLIFGTLAQATASGPWSFAGAAWVCLLPLLVLARALPVWAAPLVVFAVSFVGRVVAFANDDSFVAVADAAVAAATVAGITVAVAMAHRLVMRELPLLGSLAAPAAVVVLEWLAAHQQWPGATFLPLHLLQSGDVPFYRFVDVLTPLGISFAVAWGQSVMAGFGEAWLAEDPHPQLVRERGLRVGANLCFWLVVVVGHVGGFFKDDPTRTATHQDLVVGIAGVALVGMIVGAIVANVRRPAPPAGAPVGAGDGDTAIVP